MYRNAPSVPILIVAFGGRVFGVDPGSGRRFWEYEFESTGQGIPVRILVLGERVYAVASMELHVLEYATGRLLSKTKVPHATGSTFVHMDGRLYTAGNGAVACFGLDGGLLWADEFVGKGHGAVALAVPGYAVQGDLRG